MLWIVIWYWTTNTSTVNQENKEKEEKEEEALKEYIEDEKRLMLYEYHDTLIEDIKESYAP